MSFKTIFEHDINFNFQVNRLLSYGNIACNQKEVHAIASHIHCFETWYTEWQKAAKIAELDKRYIHSMYYYRMAEFMLTNDNPNKDAMYYKMQDMFSHAFPTVRKYKVPFKNGYLPCINISSTNASKTILVHGGYDSFIEEFYLIAKQFAQAGYNILLFEGEGQGETLRQGMLFNEKWENSVTAILNYFNIEKAALIGISWGGYLALRAASLEKRITHVVCYDALYDGFDVQLNLIDQPMKTIFHLLYKLRLKTFINFLVREKMKRNTLANWGISHGMYITGTDSPYEFYSAIAKHTLKHSLHDIDQHVLLLAGEKDHYVPLWHFNYLTKHLQSANVTTRLFTEFEGGEQHCRVGNYELAINEINSWLKQYY